MRSFRRRAGAFSLVEVALALGVASFCLIVLFGLIPLGLTTNHNSIENTLAASAAAAVASDLRSTPTATVSGQTVLSYRFGIPIPGAGGGASGMNPAVIYLDETLAKCKAGAPPVPSDARFQVSIGFVPPAAATDRDATQARILVTWPPQSGGGPASWPTNYADSYETTIALDRN